MLDLLPDLFDRYSEQLTILPPLFSQYGGKSIFFGEVVTVKCFEDNSKVKQVLNEPGLNRVLVVDGGGSKRRALLGDLIAESAVKNGWQGVIIYGFVRDVGTLKTMELGVQALGAVPIKTERKNQGELNIPIYIESNHIKPGMWVYADDNGIAFSASELSLSFLEQD